MRILTRCCQEYTVIARDGTFIHIVNVQVAVDDDPSSSNNQLMFGIEIEATTKFSVRDIWLRKID